MHRPGIFYLFYSIVTTILTMYHDGYMNEKMHFEIVIKAHVQNVWEKMLTQESYREWTAVFDPSSRYEGSWEKGSKIKFCATDGNGMSSMIADNVPHKFISIKHLGIVKDGVEDTTSDEAAKWNSAYENYTFSEQGNDTKLEVDLEIPASPDSKMYKEMFEGMWPKALLKLKEICERGG